LADTGTIISVTSFSNEPSQLKRVQKWNSKCKECFSLWRQLALPRRFLQPGLKKLKLPHLPPQRLRKPHRLQAFFWRTNTGAIGAHGSAAITATATGIKSIARDIGLSKLSCVH
jgi:hypothetical protein